MNEALASGTACEQTGRGRSFCLALAPNGARRGKRDHPALPLTPEELAQTAKAAVEVGIGMLHVHVRDPRGAHSLDADAYSLALAAIRRAVGDRLILQVTTEAAARFAPHQQQAVAIAVRPEAISLALRELCAVPGQERAFADFLAFLRRERIAPQVILYEPDEVRRLAHLLDRGLVPFPDLPVLYVLGKDDPARVTPETLLDFVAAADGRFADFMVCAFGHQEAPLTVAGVLLGGSARVGFENNLYLPNGKRAPHNEALVSAVVRPLRQLGFAPASADDWRARLHALF